MTDTETEKQEIHIHISDTVPLKLYRELTCVRNKIYAQLEDAKESILFIQAEYDSLLEVVESYKGEIYSRKAAFDVLVKIAKDRAATIGILKTSLDKYKEEFGD